MALATLTFGQAAGCPYSASRQGVSADITGPEGRRVVKRLLVIYVLVAAFWSCSINRAAWVLQAQNMDGMVFGSSCCLHRFWQQIRFDHLAYTDLHLPDLSGNEQTVRGYPSPEMCIGMFLALTPFLVTAWCESQIQQGLTPHISWQLLAYLLLSIAEVMLVITVMEFSYTQAPKRMKSLVMSSFTCRFRQGMSLPQWSTR